MSRDREFFFFLNLKTGTVLKNRTSGNLMNTVQVNNIDLTEILCLHSVNTSHNPKRSYIIRLRANNCKF